MYGCRARGEEGEGIHCSSWHCVLVDKVQKREGEEMTEALLSFPRKSWIFGSGSSWIPCKSAASPFLSLPLQTPIKNLRSPRSATSGPIKKLPSSPSNSPSFPPSFLLFLLLVFRPVPPFLCFPSRCLWEREAFRQDGRSPSHPRQQGN